MHKTIKREPKGKYCFVCGKLLTDKDKPRLLDGQNVCEPCDDNVQFEIDEYHANIDYPWWHPGH